MQQLFSAVLLAAAFNGTQGVAALFGMFVTFSHPMDVLLIQGFDCAAADCKKQCNRHEKQLSVFYGT